MAPVRRGNPRSSEAPASEGDATTAGASPPKARSQYKFVVAACGLSYLSWHKCALFVVCASIFSAFLDTPAGRKLGEAASAFADSYNEAYVDDDESN